MPSEQHVAIIVILVRSVLSQDDSEQLGTILGDCYEAEVLQRPETFCLGAYMSHLNLQCYSTNPFFICRFINRIVFLCNLLARHLKCFNRSI